MRCAVAGCNSDNQSQDFDKSVRFHTFPKNNVTKKLWVTACCRQDMFKCETSRVCSKHFKSECYQRSLQQELLNYASKKGLKLKPDAVPTINLPKSKSLSVNQERREQRAKERQSKRFVEELVTGQTSTVNTAISKEVEPFECQEDPSCSIDNLNLPSSSKSIGVNTDSNEELLELKQHILILSKQNAELLKVKSAVGKLFTPRQLKRLQNPNTRSVWSVEEVSQGIAIHAAGAKAYRLLLKKGYPLPAISTLRGWTRKIKIMPGILKPVINVIKKSELTSWGKICVLSFDEMKIRKAYVYDRTNDELLKPSNYAQVAMIRGLLSPWKQLIFYDYDRKMDKPLLFKIIEAVEKAGFYVCAIVSDLGGGNRGLHNSLGINVENPCFTSPTNHPVHVLCDVPHLLKLIRNNFLDYGFYIWGKEVNKLILENLLKLTSHSDLRITYKLNQDMINVKGAQRQKVKTASKLFSNTIAQSINRCGAMGYFENENWMECAKFFKLVNDWFDCLNVRVPHSDTRERMQGYGLQLEIQNTILDEMSEVMESLRVKGKHSLMPFQKGIMQTNNALKNLYADMQERFNIKYILTYNINHETPRWSL